MNNFTQKITSEQSEEIKTYFESIGAVFDTVQYSQWRAKTSQLQAIYYTSGKLLIQGKNIENIVAKIKLILGEINIIETPTKNNTTTLIDTNGEKYIGTDESGKGDFFGSLVIAGVQIDDTNRSKFIQMGIKDSKKLKDDTIVKMAAIIKANAVHSVVVITPAKYNELYSKFNNLNRLLAWGHARVIENILDKSPCNYALADKFGDESLIQNALLTKGKSITLKQSVRAEADIAVAAASVLARAEFVKKIQELSKKYEINFSKGVSDCVITQAKEFVAKYSYSRLNEIAKLHFKTINQI